MKYFSICVAGIIILLISPANSQDAKNIFTLYGHVAIPQGDFGDDTGLDAGYATTGYGGGFELSIPSGSTNLFYLLSANIFFNSFDDTEIKASIRRMFPDLDVSIDAGSWMNIPIMAGLQYRTEINPTLKFIGSGKIGLNIVNGPTIEISAQDVTGEIVYGSYTSFGFGIGGGILINEKICIGLTYLGLGEPEIEMEVSAQGETTKLDPYDQPISLLLISLGIAL